MTKQEIVAKIAELEKELTEVEGTVCEIYSRSVGFLRPVSAYNNGKQEEFRERVTFDKSVKT